MKFGALATATQEYVGYSIHAHLALPQSDPGNYTCTVTVVQPDKSSVQYRECIDRIYRDDASVNLPKSEDEFHRWFLVRAVSRARAAIALDELHGLSGARFIYSLEQPVTIGDDEVQFTILAALRRPRRLDPQHYGHVPLDAAGLCLLRHMSKGEFDYNRGRLEDRGWVEHWGLGWDDNNYNMRITEEGLQALEQIEREEAGKAVTAQTEPIMAETSTKYFVAHQFSRDQIDDLRAAIDSALSDSGLAPYYADNELRQGHIFKDKILEKIKVSRFGIYEISNPDRPNVFLELGAGLALGKVCIIICKPGTEVPADLQGLDRIEYQSYRDLTSQLNDKLKPYL